MSLLDRLKNIVGPAGWTTDEHEIAPHLVEWRGLYQGRTPLMLKPAATAEVAAIVALCQESATPLVVQGGNTGLVGGGVPNDSGQEILLSLKRMNKVREVNAADFSLTAEAGITVAAVQDAAIGADRLFPLSLASEGSCTLGGVISTNAGGINVLRYGVMRDLVLGLEAVLPNGQVLNALSSLRKNNTGYDLKQLLIGAEGTLGIVTAATVNLFPALKSRTTCLTALPTAKAAVDLLARAREATGDQLIAFELMSRDGLDLVLHHIPHTRDPLAKPSPWYVLMETGSPRADDDTNVAMEAFCAAALERGLITDGVVAQSAAQAQELWRLRESFSEAQKLEGDSIKHDVAVPIASIPAFIDTAAKAVAAATPSARPVIFGHVGDGNLHFNIQAPVGDTKGAFVKRWAEINGIVHDVVAQFSGSISAEHGIGVLKKDELVRYKDPVALEMMRALKRTLDPNNILGRGRIFDV